MLLIIVLLFNFDKLRRISVYMISFRKVSIVSSVIGWRGDGKKLFPIYMIKWTTPGEKIKVNK